LKLLTLQTVILLRGADPRQYDWGRSRRVSPGRHQRWPRGSRSYAQDDSAPAIGHGIGDNLTSAIDRGADVYTFLFEQLGMKYRDKAPE